MICFFEVIITSSSLKIGYISYEDKGTVTDKITLLHKFYFCASLEYAKINQKWGLFVYLPFTLYVFDDL